MGCTKSRVGPMPAKRTRAMKGARFSITNRVASRGNTGRTPGMKLWRRIIHFRKVKVSPMTHLGGGDIAAHDERRLSRFSCRRNTRPVESLLYTANNQHNGEAAVENAVLHRKLTVLPGQHLNETQAGILHELRGIGILNGQASATGSISFTVDNDLQSALPHTRRPPARLARLEKTPVVQDLRTGEHLREKMEANERRRKIKQDELLERLRAHSRQAVHHNEVAAQTERSLQQRVADKIIEKDIAFNKRVEKMIADREERVRVKSRMGDHAKEVVEIMDKECQLRAAVTVAKKQKIVQTNLERHRRLRSNRVRLSQRHRENVRRAVARRLAEQEEHAESQMQYYGEIETARFSDDESVLDPELQWLM
ncbi:uncharacterized protein LOC117287881 [Asterias rubens]|uniref:uncharacterized protein LOC117287881 n=1 Tax=Asterias rubens TaxID=7604 RepID=UPI0014555816|nr:uncharacterized protein LOC117287881 [Asterias rubens]